MSRSVVCENTTGVKHFREMQAARENLLKIEGPTKVGTVKIWTDIEVIETER